MSEYQLRPGIHAPNEEDLPEGWQAERLSQTCQFFQGGRFGLTKENSYRATGVPAFSAAGQDGFVDTVEFTNTRGVVLSAIGAKCGRCFYADGSWTTLANVQAIIPDSRYLDARYLYYRVNREDYWPRSGSAQPFIKPGDMKSCWVAYPSVEYQSKIAQILDILDTQIRQTEALIVKMERIEQGLLTDLLTRGIDENGQLRPTPDQAPHLYKDSPLGRIPKEWRAVQLGDLVSDSYRYPSYYGIDYVSAGVPEIRGELIGDTGDLVSAAHQYRYISEATARRFPRVRLKESDIVMTVRGTIGKFALVEKWLEGAVITANLLKISVDKAVTTPGWMIEVLLSEGFQGRLEQACSSTTIPTIQIPELMSIDIALPEKDEQERITAMIVSAKQKLADERALVAKLCVQKAGLMDDLLTGRVRVTSLLDPAEQGIA